MVTFHSYLFGGFYLFNNIFSNVPPLSYCDCFANGEFCSNCNCTNCFNNLEHESERLKAIKVRATHHRIINVAYLEEPLGEKINL